MIQYTQNKNLKEIMATAITTAENFNRAIQSAAVCLLIVDCNVHSKPLAAGFVQELKKHRDAVWDIKVNPHATDAQKALGLSLEFTAGRADQLVNHLKNKFELGYNYKKIALTLGVGAAVVRTVFLISQYDFSKITTHLPELSMSDFGIFDKISALFNLSVAFGAGYWISSAMK